MANGKKLRDSDVAKLHETATCPNVPSFDFNPNTGAPNLREGEKVLSAKIKEGVPVYVTDHGRAIYVCDFDTYEASFSALIKKLVFQNFFPHANKKVKRFGLHEPTCKDAKAVDRARSTETTGDDGDTGSNDSTETE